MSNNPPKDAQFYLDQLENLKGRVASWSQAEINNQTAGGLRDLINDISAITKLAEKDRKATKEPYLERGKKIDDEFRPVKSTADSFLAPLKKMLSGFLVAEEARKREAAEAARQRAEAEARAAEALKDDAFAGDRATERAEVSEIEAKRAERAVDNNTVQGDTSERAMGLRTYRSAKITNGAMLVGHYANHPDVLALCEKLANAEIRAAKGGEVSISGIQVVEEKRAA